MGSYTENPSFYHALIRYALKMLIGVAGVIIGLWTWATVDGFHALLYSIATIFIGFLVGPSPRAEHAIATVLGELAKTDAHPLK